MHFNAFQSAKLKKSIKQFFSEKCHTWGYGGGQKKVSPIIIFVWSNTKKSLLINFKETCIFTASKGGTEKKHIRFYENERRKIVLS